MSSPSTDWERTSARCACTRTRSCSIDERADLRGPPYVRLELEVQPCDHPPVVEVCKRQIQIVVAGREGQPEEVAQVAADADARGHENVDAAAGVKAE